jgi:alpha-tubulin suppressor-like RCC1 family protein
VNSLFTKFAGLALALTATGLLLTACGAGPEETANLPVRGTSVATGSPTATITPTVTAVVSPPRVVAGQIYTYQAAAPSGATVTWSWGDGSPDSVGTTVQKVWNKSGSQTVSLSANAGSSTASFTQTVAVAGEPVTTGDRHTCALQPSGGVVCWGDSSSGQIGNGTTNGNVTESVVVTGLTNAIALSAGANHTCALKAGGSVACWGNNVNGQLGDGTSGSSKPNITTVLGLTDAVAISAGQFHTCALKANASVVCWGRNIAGQLGDGNLNGNFNSNTPTTTPTPVTGLTDAVALSAGANHTCALKTGGSLVCWGGNFNGQLGDGTNNNNKSGPVPVTGITDVVALSAGSEHTCALKAGGSAACWGKNSDGQVGDGTTVPRATSTAVVGLTNAVAINAGGNINSTIFKGRTCALKANGSVACWGDQGFDPTKSATVQANATTIAGLTDTVSISAGGDHICALKASGAIACFGNDVSGQLGDGATGGAQTKFVAVNTVGGLLTDTTAMSAAGDGHTCAVKIDNTVVCWGRNDRGQLGNSTNIGTFNSNPTATAVVGLTDVAKVTAGYTHSCAVKKDSTVMCWGDNNYFQLGNTVGLTDVDAVTAGDEFTCAVKKDNTVVCWGWNSYGQLGRSKDIGFGASNTTPTPTAVVGLTDVVTLTAGLGHACAVKKDSTVVCWGNNFFGQLGNSTNIGTDNPNHTPTVVVGLTDVDTVTAGARGLHTCAVKKDNTVVCWGKNFSGQLGNSTNIGTNNPNPIPTAVVGVTDAATVTTGTDYTCVVKKDDTVVCWGSEKYTTAGTNFANPSSPTVVAGLTDASRAYVGGNHACAVKKDNTVVCWGLNDYGQLGAPGRPPLLINTSIKSNPTPVLGGAIFWK